MNRDDELERFKSGINLAEYAEAHGYEIDGRESSKASTVMRKGDDKIVVATDQDGHGVYFSVRNDADNGSIIDFIQKRQGINLGKVRQELRPWTGSNSSSYRPKRKPEAQRPSKPQPSTGDRRQVLANFSKMQPTDGHHDYLEDVRKISQETLEDPRFAGMVRKDERGNAVFPHYDQDGLSGYELKNEDFTGFSKGGQKAVWQSSNIDDAEKVVIVESAIDALSHAQLGGDPEAAYLSTGGSLSDFQKELIRALMRKAAERDAEIIIATDDDEAGRRLREELEEMAPPGAKISGQECEGGKDWNEVLQQSADAEASAEGPAAPAPAPPPAMG